MGKVTLCIRTTAVVLGNIRHIEGSWRKVHDWANCTGQGVVEDDPYGFEAEVRKRCRFYYTIHDVMQDRSSSRAVATTENLYCEENRLSTDDETKTNVFESEGSDAFVSDNEEKTNVVVDKTPTKKSKSPKLVLPSRKRNKMSFLDDQTLGLLDSTRDIEREKLDEVKCHNLVIEETGIFEKKNAELKYKMNLYESFHKMRDRGMEEEKVKEIFPEMTMFCSEFN